MVKIRKKCVHLLWQSVKSGGLGKAVALVSAGNSAAGEDVNEMALSGGSVHGPLAEAAWL